MHNTRKQVAQALLDVQAVRFSPRDPFTFKSGILSPVYVDNRVLPYHPTQWRQVISGFQFAIGASGTPFDIIAGIETAGIPHSAALSFSMKRPSVFVRKQPKEHGTGKRIEGGSVEGKRVLLIEDLVTTGGSSLSGVKALREAGAIVEDCMAIVSYGFQEALDAFTEAGVRLTTMTTFPIMAELARENEQFGDDELRMIYDWLAAPHEWGEKHGFTS